MSEVQISMDELQVEDEFQFTTSTGGAWYKVTRITKDYVFFDNPKSYFPFAKPMDECRRTFVNKKGGAQ